MLVSSLSKIPDGSPGDLYYPDNTTPPSSNLITSYKWSFADNNSQLEKEQLKKIREVVGSDTYGPSPAVTVSGSDTQRSGRISGPSLPSGSDLQLAREVADSLTAGERLAKRKRENREDRDRLEEMVGPKDVGKERMLEMKRVKREGDRSYREGKDEGGYEVSEDVLMGSGSSFKERLAQRDAARVRFEAKKKEGYEMRLQERNERVEQIKERDRKTMEMFQQMAKERYG
ncbi:hypothetical protein Clacol_007355 [Clathrus columnatus]|uniref:Uncharacterized protein n=1 Tax=Clathrus columnatus TaxID=1419009 RepID=A0AAV5AME7_9AGAM|nr:hypothetical protein Clacol_007355 [Clathrus columnatus]